MVFRVQAIVTNGQTAKADVADWHSDMSMAEVVGRDVPVPQIAKDVLRRDAERRAAPTPCTCPPLRRRKPVVIQTEADWLKFLSECGL